MRRVFAVIFGVLLLILPTAAFAQDTPGLAWDLSNSFTVKDLGFQFNYPADWVSDTSSGIYMAENDADLAAIMDADDSTQAEGYAITVVGLPLDAIGATTATPLEDIADTMVQAVGITESEGRLVAPVLSRRSLTVIGANAQKRPGLATLWKQGDFLVAMSLSGPELSQEVAVTWGVLLGRIQPTDALALGDTPFTAQSGKFTMSYPADWYIDEATGVLGENEADLTGTTPPTGIAVSVAERKMADIAPGATDLAGVMAVASTQLGWDKDETIVASEHIILGQPALSMSGPAQNIEDAYLTVTVTLLDEETVLTIAIFHPSKEQLDSFAPTSLTMLKSITATEPAS